LIKEHEANSDEKSRNLKDKTENLESVNIELESSRKAVRKFESQLSESVSECDGVKTVLETVKIELDVSKKAVVSLESQICESKQICDQLNLQLADLVNSRDVLEARLLEANTNLDCLRADVSKSARKLEFENRDLIQLCEERNVRLKTLEQSVLDLQGEAGIVEARESENMTRLSGEVESSSRSLKSMEQVKA
jgi:chromosome segregation ATPase